jgi:hypothetical protein
MKHNFIPKYTTCFHRNYWIRFPNLWECRLCIWLLQAWQPSAVWEVIITLVNTQLHNIVHSLSPENTVMFATNAIFTIEDVNTKYTLFAVACNPSHERRQIIPGLPIWIGPTSQLLTFTLLSRIQHAWIEAERCKESLNNTMLLSSTPYGWHVQKNATQNKVTPFANSHMSWRDEHKAGALRWTV